MKNKKWIEVYNALKQRIENGDYKRGDNFFTIAEVSKRFNVSQITSRKALSALPSDNLIIQKPGLGSVVKNRERIKIHFFVPEEQHWDIKRFRNIPFINFEILKGAMQQATAEGVEIEFINSRLISEIIRKEPVIVLYGTFNLKKIQNTTYNLIVLHSYGPSRYFHTVRHNLYKSAYYATKHLISRGHRRIGLVTGFFSTEGWLPRFEGYLQALKEADIPLNLTMIRETSGYDREEDINAFKGLLSQKDPPTAICAGNDSRALNILDYCCRKGMKVPEEIAICGIDNIYETEFSKPPLTTVDTGWERIGKTAINFILELLDKPASEIQDIVVEPELIIRKST